MFIDSLVCMLNTPLTFFWALQRVSSISSSLWASSFLFSFLICSMAISSRNLADSSNWTWPANSSSSSSYMNHTHTHKKKGKLLVSQASSFHRKKTMISHLIFDFHLQFVFGSPNSGHVSIGSTFCGHFVQFFSQGCQPFAPHLQIKLNTL